MLHPGHRFSIDLVKFKDLHVMELPAVDVEPEGRPHEMEPVDSCGARIQYHHIPLPVRHHLQDMGVPADKQVRPVLVYQGSGPGVISPGIPPDMDHQDLHPATAEQLVHGIVHTDVIAVYIAVDTPQRLECGDCLRGLQRAEIPGMPDFVDRLQEVHERPVECPVRVRYQSYVHDILVLLIIP